MLARRLAIPALPGLLLGLASIAAAGEQPKAPPARDWSEARVALRAAGRLATDRRYRAADGYLSYYAERLGKPYDAMIARARKRIAALAGESGKLGAYDLKGRQIALCMDLGAYRTALRLAREIREKNPEDPANYSRHLGWCLLETGRVKEAGRERSRRPGDVPEGELKLATRIDSGENGAGVLLEFVRAHYLRDRGDRLGALDRLTVALQKPHRGKARLDIYAAIFEQFRKLGDDRGLRAWEERLLADFARDSASRSVVHMARGERAAANKDYDEAVAQLAEVLSGEIRDPARGELVRAFIDRRHRAAMLASECCEKKRDWSRAHEYAVAAREHYKPWKQTGAEAAIALRRLNVRIRKLAARLDQQKTAASPSP